MGASLERSETLRGATWDDFDGVVELRTGGLARWRTVGTHEEEPEWPDGIAARTCEPADAPAVHALLDEAYGGWDITYVPVPHKDWVAWMTGDAEFDPTAWWLAER